jgi:hypothetical protein
LVLTLPYCDCAGRGYCAARECAARNCAARLDLARLSRSRRDYPHACRSVQKVCLIALEKQGKSF